MFVFPFAQLSHTREGFLLELYASVHFRLEHVPHTRHPHNLKIPSND